MANWSFDILTDFERIWSSDNLAKWKNLYGMAVDAHVFFHPLMVRAWIDTYLPLRDIKPIFVWAKDEEGNQAFMPLVLWRRNWKHCFMRSIVPVGYSDYDYHDPISNVKIDTTFYSQLIDKLKKSFSFDEITLDGIRDRAKGKGEEWSRGEICPQLSLNSLHDEDGLLKFLKTSLRGDIRRQIRRLQEIGELDIVEYKNKADAMRTFGEFMECHAKRWPNAYKAPHFHENLISDEMLGNVTHFSSLNVRGTPIAWHLGFEYDGRYYYYMPAGNPEYSTFSPVKIHLFKLITRAIENGDKTFDHLRGDENYKQGWSNEEEYVNTYDIRSESLQSKLKLLGLKFRDKVLR